MSDLYQVNHEHCDADALPAESTTASSLGRDAFHKICPGSLTFPDGGAVPLGQPRCGDGSNFSFVFSRPAEEAEQPSSSSGGQKIVLELAGGGACWDATTCSLQSRMLSFPSRFDDFVGTSCSDYEGKILCAKTVGGTDFRGYNFVFVPYCTQDVHMGDVPEGTEYGVRHVGAHNLRGTLDWMFDNFPDPEEIFITGCSAGGTPLPVVYDMINSHYSSKDVDIDVILDSPVYLTPNYFLDNYLPNWNAGTLISEIGFDFDSNKDERMFPTYMLDHVLGRSKADDNFGFISHDADAVSLFYYRMMSDASELGDDITEKWWGEMTESLEFILEKHGNVHTYFMEGTGHCSFSLNVPLDNEGFDAWATGVLQDEDILHEVESDGLGSFASVSNTTTQSTVTSLASTSGPSSVSGAPISGAAADVAPAASNDVLAPSGGAGALFSDSNDVVQMTIDLSGSTPPNSPPSLTTTDAAAGTANIAGRQSSPALALTVMVALAARLVMSPTRSS